MTDPGPVALYQQIREGYLRYFETAFWLRDPGMRAERRRLIEQDRVLFTDPLIEAVMPYEPGPSIGEVAHRLNLRPGIARQLGAMLFGADESFRLREHQARSLETSLAVGESNSRNLVVTSG